MPYLYCAQDRTAAAVMSASQHGLTVSELERRDSGNFLRLERFDSRRSFAKVDPCSPADEDARDRVGDSSWNSPLRIWGETETQRQAPHSRVHSSPSTRPARHLRTPRSPTTGRTAVTILGREGIPYVEGSALSCLWSFVVCKIAGIESRGRRGARTLKSDGQASRAVCIPPCERRESRILIATRGCCCMRAVSGRSLHAFESNRESRSLYCSITSTILIVSL